MKSKHTPDKAHAEVRPIDNKWVASCQAPGSFNIESKTFDTESEAVEHANKFLEGYRDYKDPKNHRS